MPSTFGVGKIGIGLDLHDPANLSYPNLTYQNNNKMCPYLFRAISTGHPVTKKNPLPFGVGRIDIGSNLHNPNLI